MIEALGAMGPEAKPAVTALAKIVTDDPDFVLQAFGGVRARARSGRRPAARPLALARRSRIRTHPFATMRPSPSRRSGPTPRRRCPRLIGGSRGRRR